jgi:hypothetical protein
MMAGRPFVFGLVAIALAGLAGTEPAGAQAANACATALQQALQNVAKARIELNDAYIKLQAQYTIAINNCPKNDPTGYQQCLTQVQNQFNPLRQNLDNDSTLLTSEANQASNNFNPNNCLWSAQEITQLVATLGQATSQITQSIAQVISAAKGKGTQGTASGSSSGGKTTKTSPPSQAPQPTPAPAPAPTPAPGP